MADLFIGGGEGEPGSSSTVRMCPEGWQGLEAVEGSEKGQKTPAPKSLREINEHGCPSPAPDSQGARSWC